MADSLGALTLKNEKSLKTLKKAGIKKLDCTRTTT